MPHYFFHLLDARTANLVKDFSGVGLLNIGEAKREAVGFAQDILKHRLHGSGWQVVVTDAHANVILRVSFSNVRPRELRTIFDIAHRMVLYEPRVRTHIFTWLLTAAVLALILESTLLIGMWRHTGDLTPN